MSLKDDLRITGEAAKRTFRGFYRSVKLTVKAASDKLNDAPQKENEPSGEGLKQSWLEVGSDLGQAGLSLGKVIVGASKKAAGAAYNALERAEDSIEKHRK